jgi:hypothetical protein
MSTEQQMRKEVRRETTREMDVFFLDIEWRLE